MRYGLLLAFSLALLSSSVVRADDVDRVVGALEDDAANGAVTTDGPNDAAKEPDASPRAATEPQARGPDAPAGGEAESAPSSPEAAPASAAPAVPARAAVPAPAPAPASQPAPGAAPSSETVTAPAPTSAPAPTPAPTSQPAPEAPAAPDFMADLFEKGAPGYYAVAYGADWAFVALSAGLMATGTWELIQPPVTLLGPAHDDKAPDLAGLRDPRLAGVIGRPYLQEKVPTWALIAAEASLVAAAGVVDGFSRQDFHHTHALVLGAATTAMLTLDVTEVLKLSFGRLRPDFGERYTRAACQGIVSRPDALDCSVVDDGFKIEREDYVDGFKSFPSGHASSSFAMATYLSLWLGSEWIWGARATDVSQPLASLAVGGLYAGALFTAASRVSDNRHHLEDVAVGAALGAAIGAATWLLYFDLDGEARWRDLTITPTLDEHGGGVAVAGRF